MVGSALSTILYAGIIAANHLGYIGSRNGGGNTSWQHFAFRLTCSDSGPLPTWGPTCTKRLRIIEGELKEKIDSVTQLQRLNEHIVSSIRSGLITTDLHGRIAVFNIRSAGAYRQRRTGNARQAHSIADWRNFLGSDSPAPICCAMQSLCVTKNGSRFPTGPSDIWDSASLLSWTKVISCWAMIISFQDLTEIIRLEEEVRLKDRMAAVGRMAAGIAHEIRNPLTSMRGSVEILRSHANFPAKDERLLDILIRESDRLESVCRGFSQFRPSEAICEAPHRSRSGAPGFRYPVCATIRKYGTSIPCTCILKHNRCASSGAPTS